MQNDSLICREEERREAVRSAPLLGLDYVEVDDTQRTLYVHMLGKAPSDIEKNNLLLTGGVRIRDVRILSLRVRRQADPTLDDLLEIQVDKPGDFSTYTISCVQLDDSGAQLPMQGFDPFYASVSFTFKSGCATTLDCAADHSCPPAALVEPEIDYLSKDYGSFRQLILDRLALIMPGWEETHAADLGIALVELLAYTGDYLSYFQDAVAPEAYLGTARERISVRRHARLVDYRMHEGCNARAWLTIGTDLDQQLDPSVITFITAFPGAPAETVLSGSDLVNVPETSYEVFQALGLAAGTPLLLYASHTAIDFYTWGEARCCLAKGATSATLVDAWVTPATSVQAPQGEQPRATQAPPQRVLHLQVGDVLIFEEVLGPHTGNAADADPTHRQAVRLTSVSAKVDTLYKSDANPDGQPVLAIEWGPEDALGFALCISSRMPPPDCGPMLNVSVARGNVVLVDHGRTTTETLGVVPTATAAPGCADCCAPASVTVTAGRFNPVLTDEPLTASQPLGTVCAAADLFTQDPRQALPVIRLDGIPAAPVTDTSDAVPLFTFDDLALPAGLAAALHADTDPAAQALLALLSPATRQQLTAWKPSDPPTPLPSALALALTADLTSLLQSWQPVADLLESGASDRSFVVETDNDGYGHLRFGDGVLGLALEAGTELRATYRIGNGVAGNVGAESIRYIVFADEKLSGVTLTPRNPLAAMGGIDPEPIDEVKQFAPFTFGTVLERAITADDYATIAADNTRRLAARSSLIARDKALCGVPFRSLQNAKAELRWTGSWYTALVALDPQGEEGLDASLDEEIKLYLEPYRRMGQDLLVQPAVYVPLKVTICVCVLPNYLRGHVESAVMARLTGSPDGFFQPDNLSFGDGIYVSQLIAAVQAVPGVRSVKVTELERLSGAELFSGPPKNELPANAVLTLGPLEIARLDANPNSPEDGVLVLDMRGGR